MNEIIARYSKRACNFGTRLNLKNWGLAPRRSILCITDAPHRWTEQTIPKNPGLAFCPVTGMDRIVNEAVTFAHCNGFLMAAKGDANLTHTPFSLTPARVRSDEYHLSRKISSLLNQLTLDVASDHSYLKRTLSKTAAGDPHFTGRLLDLLDVARPASIEFTINRYDFFPNSSAERDAPRDARGLRMVEMNCFAPGGLAQAGIISDMHRALLKHPSAADAGVALEESAMLPSNELLREGARAFADAHRHFCELYKEDNARIAVIVIPPYVNACDQDMLRWRIWNDHGIDCIRMTLDQIVRYGSLRDDGALVVEDLGMSIPKFVLSVAYFRSGYMPEEYPTENEWLARSLLERSSTVMCPSVAMQLVGTKRVQQALSEPGVLESFCKSREDVQLIRSCFVQQYALHPGPEGERARKLGIDDPDGYVMKPQREGGGNNLYTQEMKNTLMSLNDERRGAFILMQRIHPAVVKGVFVRDTEWEQCDIVAELGIYGVALRKKKSMLENSVIGHSMKSKMSTIDDGGIGAGVAVYDSPQLVQKMEDASLQSAS